LIFLADNVALRQKNRRIGRVIKLQLSRPGLLDSGPQQGWGRNERGCCSPNQAQQVLGTGTKAGGIFRLVGIPIEEASEDGGSW
jgi:hypothetical protein